VRVGSVNTTSSSYYTSGDYLRITYERP
jgi:hypothetical protein